jgi:SAM-dependent methyltransferase
MMFGLRHRFVYFECATCGCLQLEDPPPTWDAYYPREYYSFAAPAEIAAREAGWLRHWLFRGRNRGYLLGRPWHWRWVARLRQRPDLEGLRTSLDGLSIPSLDARILDVGCGSGDLLRRMHAAGFSRLTGVDPFLPADDIVSAGLRLLARPLHELDEGDFDVIMFHHSLEHIRDQHQAISAGADRLARTGVCIVRIPIADCDVWREFGTDWVELDAPRHHVLHTRKSLAMLANRAGLAIDAVTCDAMAFGYWGSVLYTRDVSLMDPETGRLRDPSAHFGPDELKRFSERAAEANDCGVGGRALFVLRPCAA